MKFNVITRILLLTSVVLPRVVSAGKDVGLGHVASNLMESVSFVSDFVLTACFVIGASFLFAGIIKYVEHRRSPLMVPISTVMFLLIAGLILLLLPLLSMLTEGGMPFSIYM